MTTVSTTLTQALVKVQNLENIYDTLLTNTVSALEYIIANGGGGTDETLIEWRENELLRYPVILKITDLGCSV